MAYLSKTKYSVFRTENGIIPIIQDKYHDQIINEINKRKKAQLLEWHREIYPDNTYENEIEKFRWLVEEEAMNTREAEEKIQQVKALQMNSFPISSKKLN